MCDELPNRAENSRKFFGCLMELVTCTEGTTTNQFRKRVTNTD